MIAQAEGAMLSNAVSAIEVGIEDVQATDTRRAASAVRNLHAGVMLLLKEVLHRLGPELISVRLQPELSDAGTIHWKPEGRNTLDLQGLRDRWKALKLPELDWPRIQQLNLHRNDIEHRAPSTSSEGLRETIANTFVVVDEVVRQCLKESPAHLFETNTWSYMVSETALHKKLSDACKASRVKIASKTDGILPDVIVNQLACEDCGSELLRVAANGEYPDVDAECVACGGEWIVRDLVEAWAKSEGDGDGYRIIDGGEPLWGTCPSCNAEAYSIEENRCLICLEAKEYDRCLRCDEALGLEDQHLDGMCGYCAHVMDSDD